MKSSSSFRWLTPLAVAGALLFWASAFPGVRVGLKHFSPGHLALARYLIASLALGVWALATRSRLPARRDLPQVALLGLLGFTIYNVAFNYGETRVSSGTASFIINTSPIYALLWTRLWLGEEIPRRAWLGIIVGFLGVALLALGEGDWQFNPYALILVISALSGSGYIVLQKSLLARCDVPGLITVSVWFGTLFLMVFAPGLLTELRQAPPAALWGVFYLGVFPGAAAYALWAYALSRLPVARMVSFLYLIPPLATLLAWVWLHEVPPNVSLLGGGVALSGVIWANAARRKAI